MNAEDPLEALKAQAIAAKTYALRRALNRQSVDDTANCQAFRAERMGHTRSQQAVREIGGIVLVYEGQLIQAYFSNSNGGMIKCSGNVWRTHLPYYMNCQDDWDMEARAKNPSIRVSHGVGLSQVGTVEAAKQGTSYTEILAFYDPETRLIGEYGDEKEDLRTVEVRATTITWTAHWQRSGH